MTMLSYHMTIPTLSSFGWSGLTAELEMEIKRLARRNLGRDDRYSEHPHSGTRRNGQPEEIPTEI